MSKLVKYFGVNYRKGDCIFREGDPADVMYMIHKGKVQISKGSGSFNENIRILGEGEFIGEMAVINSMPRSATAVAAEDCILIKMDRESFNETVQKNHEFSVSVIKLLSERLRETDELLMGYVKKDRVQSLYVVLLEGMLAAGKRDGSGRWSLVRRDAFVNTAADRLKWDKSDVRSVIEEMLATGKVAIKRDREGSEWLAVPLP